MTDWKPGDVGITAQGRLALRRRNDPDGWVDSQGAPWSNNKFPSNVRPLVVIDPEDREGFERLMRIVRDATFRAGYVPRGFADAFQAALRSLVEPPRPAEPTGLGAMVEDERGDIWIRNNPYDDCKWRSSDGTWCDYADIAAVKVLSEGVTP